MDTDNPQLDRLNETLRNANDRFRQHMDTHLLYALRFEDELTAIEMHAASTDAVEAVAPKLKRDEDILNVLTIFDGHPDGGHTLERYNVTELMATDGLREVFYHWLAWQAATAPSIQMISIASFAWSLQVKPGEELAPGEHPSTSPRRKEIALVGSAHDGGLIVSQAAVHRLRKVTIGAWDTYTMTHDEFASAPSSFGVLASGFARHEDAGEDTTEDTADAA